MKPKDQKLIARRKSWRKRAEVIFRHVRWMNGELQYLGDGWQSTKRWGFRPPTLSKQA